MATLLVGSANTEDVIILDDFPVEGSKERYSRVLRFEDRHTLGRFRGIGGSAVNWSFWIKATGGDPLLVCPIGSDVRGQELRDELRDAGIPIVKSDDVVLADDFAPEGLAAQEPDSTAHSYIIVCNRNWSRTVISATPHQGTNTRWAGCVLDVVKSAIDDSRIDTAMIGNISPESPNHCYTPKIIEAIKSKRPDIFIYANLGSSQVSLPYDAWNQSLEDVGCFQFSLSEAKDFVMAGESNKSRRPTLEEVLAAFSQKRLNIVVTLNRSGAVSFLDNLTTASA